MGKRAVAFALVAIMVFSGFGILTVGVDQDVGPTVVDDYTGQVSAIGAEDAAVNPVPEQRETPTSGVLKTVMVEEFTNARCTFCPMAEANLVPVLENFTYQKAAPLAPHVWWPASNDTIWQYSQTDVTPRKNYYNFNGVPYSVFDGAHVRHAIGSPQRGPYVEYMEKALGVLSRFTITTYGDLGTETVGCMVEAQEVIEANPDRYIRFGFWETDIDVYTRFGGESLGYFDTYHWAMWDMLPDAQGEQVFPTGASPGDKVWFNRSFLIDPGQGMIEENLGVSIWIQDDTDHYVEQAAVEDFQTDTPLPVHELCTYGLEVGGNPLYTLLGPLNEVAAGDTIQVNGTVCNWGDTDETNIDVDLLVDGVPQGLTQTIPSLEAGHGQVMTFDWNVPVTAGDYWIGVQCEVMAGETNTTNNVAQRPVTVVPMAIVQPSSLADMDFYAQPDDQDYDNITLDNVGMADLYYDVDIGKTVDAIGNWNYGTSSIFNYDNGGCFYASSSTTLVEQKMMLEITGAVNLCWVVYEGTTQTGVYNHVSNVSTPNPPLGRGWYSSGPINVPITAGLYYIIGITWTSSGGLTYGFGEQETPFPVSFGEYRGRWYNLIDIPPPPTVDPIIISPGLVIQQALVTDDGTGDWLSAMPDPGTIPPSGTQDIMMTADATGLAEGTYPTTLTIWTNDPSASIMTCTATFHVIGNMPPLADLTTPNGGEVWMGGVSNTIWWNMTDDDPMSNLMVDIYYSTDGGSSWTGTVATGLTGFTANPCSYDWNPTPLLDNDQMRMRIFVTDPYPYITVDSSAANFEIDSTAPAPATNVHAELVGLHVQINWDASASGDIDHYEVYFLANTWDPTGDSYGFLANTGMAMAYQHNNVGINNPSSYYYQIRTFDVAGHETRTNIQAVKHGSTQSNFVSDWHLLGYSIILSDTSVEYVLQGNGIPANVDHVMLYRNGTWLHWTPYWPPQLNTLEDIYPGEGFWMHITASTRWAVAGYIDDISIPMRVGWNCVAYPFANRQAISGDIMTHLSVNCPFYTPPIYILDPSAPYLISPAVGTETILVLSAFWVKVDADSNWTVLNY